MEQETQQPSNKRKAEEEAGEDGGDAQPAAKAAKTDEAVPAAAAPEAAAEAEADAAEPSAEGAEAASAEAAAEAAPAEPVTIGYKTFAAGKECFTYYHGLITKLRKYQNLNDVSGGRGVDGQQAAVQQQQANSHMLQSGTDSFASPSFICSTSSTWCVS